MTDSITDLTRRVSALERCITPAQDQAGIVAQALRRVSQETGLPEAVISGESRQPKYVAARRQVVEIAHLQGCSVRSIAQVIGRSENAVRWMLRSEKNPCAAGCCCAPP